jgi:demethylmenaquinone methyltransferase / 2-methoxy-6-polyprenyl-1,4-benzoquinol methylase
VEHSITANEPRAIRAMFARIAPRYDCANLLLSCGCDKLWRQFVARMVQNWSPTRILDLATGSGVLAADLRTRSPQAKIVGADFCLPMLERAKKRHLKHLVVADGMALPFRNDVFDVVTIAFGLRNMASMTRVLAETQRVLTVGGHLVILDFSIPPAPLSWFYRPYLHLILPRVAGLLTGEGGAYRYLARSIEQFPRGRRFLEILESVGFVETQAQPLSGGVVSVYSGKKVS